MSQPATIEKCQWVGDNTPGNCPNTATLHVNWLLNNGDQRERHLCEGHTADLRERPCGAEYKPLDTCGASCQIVLRNAQERQN
jgi:hypothetical protein